MSKHSHLNDARYLRIGIQFGSVVGFHCTLEELARELGCSKQLAFYYSNVALGKLIYRLRETMGVKI